MGKDGTDGEKGDKGDKGDTGEKGDKGDKGGYRRDWRLIRRDANLPARPDKTAHALGISTVRCGQKARFIMKTARNVLSG